MPNLYKKLMAKDMPAAAPAPTATQIGQAPMGLRSAMKRFAEGGQASAASEGDNSNQALLQALIDSGRLQPQGMTPPPVEVKKELTPGYARPEEPRYATPPMEETKPNPQPVDDTGLLPPELRTPRTGGITMDDGTFIAGADNGQGGVDIGGPAFFAKYANDPVTMARLKEMYGFTGAEPDYPKPMYDPGYEAKYEPMPEPMYDPGYEPQTDPRMDMIRKALSGQGVGSIADSQQLASLLQSLGYSK